MCYITDPICSEPCNEQLDCEHTCSGTCGLCYQGRLHMQCNSDCKRVLVCGHKCNFPCSSNCPPCIEKCMTFCSHSHCPKNALSLVILVKNLVNGHALTKNALDPAESHVIESLVITPARSF